MARQRSQHRNLTVLYEDNHLIAIDKPPGLLTQGDASGEISALDAVKAYLKDKYDKPGKVYLGMVHRLDRPASGVLLFARTSKAAGRLSAQFREREVEKIYWAVVRGVVEPGEATLRHHLARDEAAARTVAVDADRRGAQEAVLQYRVLGVQRERSLLEIELLTGRKHQVRAQLSAIGHPVVGDRRYGATAYRKDGSIALHSRSLMVAHPTRNEPVLIEAEVPEGWPWA